MNNYNKLSLNILSNNYYPSNLNMKTTDVVYNGEFTSA